MSYGIFCRIVLEPRWKSYEAEEDTRPLYLKWCLDPPQPAFDPEPDIKMWCNWYGLSPDTFEGRPERVEVPTVRLVSEIFECRDMCALLFETKFKERELDTLKSRDAVMKGWERSIYVCDVWSCYFIKKIG